MIDTTSIDTASPLTSIGSEVGSDRLVRAGSDTSQQSEGSSAKTTKRRKLESEDEYKDEGSSEDEEMVQPQEDQDTSISAPSTQKRKRKSSRSVLSNEEDDSSYQPSGYNNLVKGNDTFGASDTSTTRVRSASRRSTSSSAAKDRSTEHTLFSRSDDRSFTAPSGSARPRSVSNNSASQEREVKRLQVDGTWGEKNPAAPYDWSVRPKRHAAKRYPDYEVPNFVGDGRILEEQDIISEAEQSKVVIEKSVPKPKSGKGSGRGRKPWKNVVKVEDTSYLSLDIDHLVDQTGQPGSAQATEPAMLKNNSDSQPEVQSSVAKESAQLQKKRRGRPPWKHLVKSEDALARPTNIDTAATLPISAQSLDPTDAQPVEREDGVELFSQPPKGQKAARKIVPKVANADVSSSLNASQASGSVQASKPKKPTKRKSGNAIGSDLDVLNVDDLDGDDSILSTISSVTFKPGRSRREAAKKVTSYYIPQIELDDDIPGSSDVEIVKPKNIFKARIKMKEATNGSEPSSFDSLFDETASALSEDEDVAVPPISFKVKQKYPSSSVHNTSLIEAPEYSLIERDGKTYYPQDFSCQRHLGFQQCRYCVARQAGDTCRFLGIRAVPVRIVNGGISFLTEFTKEQDGPIFIDDKTLNEEVVLADHYDLNRPMDDANKVRIMTTAAISLVGILREGLEHAKKPGCIQRARELQIRAMCDFCSTGLFSASYLCKRCGGEYCLPCKEVMDAASVEDTSRSQLYTCVKDKLGKNKSVGRRHLHSSKTMFPVSRFSIQELEEEVAVMEKIIEENACNIPTSTMQPEIRDSDADATSMQPTQVCEAIPSHQLAVEDKRMMDETQFLSTWAKGEPIVVTNIRTRKDWTPKAFVKKYGAMDCEIVRCDEHAPFMFKEKMIATLRADPTFLHEWEKGVKVRDFFNTFGKADEARAAIFGKGIWKLKDWPPAAEFDTAFPDIYEDFNYAVPMPDYTRRDGCSNISSLFPKNANGPDLGPKMYNAWPGEHSKGKKGTTCLHMDVADAVNILLYAAPRDGMEQAAQWDIFRAEDANAIRDFLREKHPEEAGKGDPIHAQVHFLDDDALQDLYREKGVYSWRILQRAGQAVFIPAGCAHQVCNLTDCIKVAVDFISPQNVARCFQLTEEFRGLSLEGRKSWKEDVLQLKAQLWYAWKACRALRPVPTEEEFEAVPAYRALKKREQQAAIELRDMRKATAKSKKERQKAADGSTSSASPMKELRTPEIVVVVDPDQVQATSSTSEEIVEAPAVTQVQPDVIMESIVKLEEVESVTSALPAAEEAITLRFAGDDKEILIEAANKGDLIIDSVEEAEVSEGEAMLGLGGSVAEAIIAEAPSVEEIAAVSSAAEEITEEITTAKDAVMEDLMPVKPDITVEVNFVEPATIETEAPLDPGQVWSDPVDEAYESAEESHERTTEIAAEIRLNPAPQSSLTVEEEHWEPHTPTPPTTPPRPPHLQVATHSYFFNTVM